MKPAFIELKKRILKFYIQLKISCGACLQGTLSFFRNYGQGRLQKFFQSIWRLIQIIFISSIRVKLTLFIGSLIFLAILISSLINVNQQSDILSQSYEREATISKTYIASLVLEMDAIAESLIQVEEFRSRVRSQKQALRRYRQTRTIIKENKISFFGFQTNLFGTLGNKNVSYSADTYFSKYLTVKDIKKLEYKTRQRLEIVNRSSISNHKFLKLQFLARKFTNANQKISKLNEELSALEKKSPATYIDQPEQKKQPRTLKQEQALQKGRNRVRRAANFIRQSRLNLDHAITQLLLRSTNDRIHELGLDLNRFRIQTFARDAMVVGEDASPTLDTSIFDAQSNLNQDLQDATLRKHLDFTMGRMQAEISSADKYESLELQTHAMDIQAHYAPHFRNPASTGRAMRLKILNKQSGVWQEYLDQEKEINNNINDLQPEIQARLESLKKRRPPLPPFRDKDFLNLYKKYSKLESRRRDLFTEHHNHVQGAGIDSFEMSDALAHLRDAALADLILIRFEEGQGFEERYRISDEEQSRRQNRWKSLRRWIYNGRSETPPDWLQGQFPDAMIIRSRTEAEQILWQLDRRPLIASNSGDVISFVLDANFAGVIRTLINRTEGLQAIRENRNRTLITSALVLCLSIFLAIIVSGIIVSKIKRIIRSAESVGDGNLNVEFKHGGADEFGNLTVALNSMVSGLREREKIKGILGNMVDPVVVGEAMKDLGALKRGMEKPITAFFSDIAGFSTISEQLSSIDLAAVLNEYLSAMTNILKEYDGVLDKYIGDAIVGIFNAPVDVNDYTVKAVTASLRMVDRMQELRDKWTATQSYTPEVRAMHFRIGLHTGPAKVGFMGTDALASYTMMGDTVNLAARLEAAARDYGVCILATEAVHKQVQAKVLTRKLDLIRVKGKTEPVIIYEMISDKSEIIDTILEPVQLYEEGLNYYLDRNWDMALNKLKASEIKRGKKRQSSTDVDQTY